MRAEGPRLTAVLYTPAPYRSLNELRVLLLEANRHSPGPERDLSREVHKAEWRIKEQKLKDDIRSLREKLTGLVRGEGGGLGIGDTREGLGQPAVQALETGDLLEPPQGLPSHSEGSKSPRTTGRVSSVADHGRATEGPREAPFGDIMAGCVAVWVMRCKRRFPKNLTSPEVQWPTVRW